MNYSNIKNQFPIFKKHPNLQYLDNASTTQKPQAVIDAVNSYYKETNANIHRGVYELSTEATQLWKNSHRTVADFINAKGSEEIIFTSGTTQSLNLVANLIAINRFKPDTIVVLSEMEHHSNIVPWQILQKTLGFEIAWIPVKEDFTLDFDWYSEFMSKSGDKVSVVSLVHTSNVLGTTNDVKKYFDIARKYGALTVLDAAQSVANRVIDVQELGCDFMAFSGHKIYGPTGIGVLYGRKDLLNEFEPVWGGGDMIRSVSKNKTTWNELPIKFEPGTPNIAGGIGLGAAVKWLTECRSLVTQKSYEDGDISVSSLADKTANVLSQFDYVSVFRPNEEISHNNSIVSFSIDGIHPHDAVSILDEHGYALRGGYHCAEILHKELLTVPTIRASLESIMEILMWRDLLV